MPLNIVILAAGKGSRMLSSLPKVLHPVGGLPMLAHVINTGLSMNPNAIHVVYGHGGEQVKSLLTQYKINWVEQKEQLGTGHAVMQAIPNIPDDDTVLILYGDVPLISEATLQQVVENSETNKLSLLTAKLKNPSGYGRMLRDMQGQLTGIKEQKDASEDQLLIDEVNTGFLACNAGLLRGWLALLGNTNAQGEYYLTDIVEMAATSGIEIESCFAAEEAEILGVNDRKQLANIERLYQTRYIDDLMLKGVTLLDPSRVDVRGQLNAGQDCTIDINTLFEGEVSLGDNVSIGANCCIKNAIIGNDVVIKPNCVIEDAQIGNASTLGPFARIRPDTVLAENVHVGNFVEIKKSSIGQGSKVNHLSYIGDTEMGSKVNVGAGTITCNYDGAYKHLTQIGDNVFIGSDTQLIAPVKVEDGATIGAGSTISKTAPANELTLSRTPQQTIKGWDRPVKNN